ncbi:unnamed protein product, partial [Ilex paraguariensis]
KRKVKVKSGSDLGSPPKTPRVRTSSPPPYQTTPSPLVILQKTPLSVKASSSQGVSFLQAALAASSPTSTSFARPAGVVTSPSLTEGTGALKSIALSIRDPSLLKLVEEASHQ